MLLSSIDRLYLYTDITKNVPHTMRFTNWLATVSKNIQDYLDRDFELKSRTVYFDSIYNKKEYFVNAHPIISISSIKLDSTSEFIGNEYTLETDLYRIGVDENSIIIDNSMKSILKSVQIVYTGGLATSAVRSIFGIKNVTGGTMTVGNYIKGENSESWGIIKAISSTSITIEVLAGYFENEEVLTEYTSLTGTAGSKTVQIDSVTSRCLAEEYPDIVTACEMQVAYMTKHHENGDFDTNGTDKEGVSYRRNSNKPYNLEPEVRMLLDHYTN